MPLPSAADGKHRKAFAVRRCRQSFFSLCRQPLLANWPNRSASQEAQLPATWPLCRPLLMAKRPLPSVADGKEPAYWLFFSVFLNPTIFTANIYDIYRYISQSYLTAHKFHRTYIYSSIHSYIASSIKIAKLHIHITMQSFIKIASSIVAS